MQMPNGAERRPEDAWGTERGGDVGILTFHCADNFGAMLQAYGLKHFLRGQGVQADIVRYAPLFMTGRYWWAPYVPASGLRGMAWSLLNMGEKFFQHLCARREFAARKANMNRFRREYLIDLHQPKIRLLSGLRRLPYRTYVVGSDQIWNPDITFGLRRVYFGAFQSAWKERVVSYAASLGSASLPPRYDGEFARLVRHVDAVSLREAESVPYVKRFHPGEVAAVLDPVFLLERPAWEAIERRPSRTGYILVYATERNPRMTAYMEALSQRTGLRVIELERAHMAVGFPTELDRSAGPAEFLGYIHGADYVVTNSFHAAAFSILYQKRFLAFAHSRTNARIENILRLHGLEDRLCWAGGDIDAPVDWEAVRARTAAEARKSGAFLLKSLCQGAE